LGMLPRPQRRTRKERKGKTQGEGGTRGTCRKLDWGWLKRVSTVGQFMLLKTFSCTYGKKGVLKEQFNITSKREKRNYTYRFINVKSYTHNRSLSGLQSLLIIICLVMYACNPQS